jgi:hypothetical protein
MTPDSYSWITRKPEMNQIPTGMRKKSSGFTRE